MNNEIPFVRTISEFTKQFYTDIVPKDVAFKVILDSLSPGQIMSKQEVLFIAQKFLTPDARCFFIGHWHAFLPRLLKNYGLLEKADGMDLDMLWVNFSKFMNADWEWNSVCGDANSANLETYNFIFNTSCEHMADDWLKNVSSGTYVLAQSTNFSHPTHTHTSHSLDEFSKKFNSFKIVNQSEIDCEYYKRFTILGIKL